MTSTQLLYYVAVVLWMVWGFSFIKKRKWKSADLRTIEIETYIIYTLALIFIGIVFSTLAIL